MLESLCLLELISVASLLVLCTVQRRNIQQSMAFKVPWIPPVKKEGINCPSLPVVSFAQFRNKEEIGCRSCGAVFTTKDQNARKVVMKKLLGQDPQKQNTFIKEALMLHAMDHENIAKFQGIGTSPFLHV